MTRSKNETTPIEGKLDTKNWVQKSDPIALMRTVPFTLGELKILDTYISRINAADEEHDTVIFTQREFEKLLGYNCDYRTLKKSTAAMLNKMVTLTMPDKSYKQFILFEEADYCKNENGEPIIKMTCTRVAKPLFFCIKQYHFFEYVLENVLKLTRKSSYLLYVYAVQNHYKKKWKISLTKLRDEVLDCKDCESYRQYKIFKRDVLDPAIKELNTKTDCHVEYTPIKRGRAVVEIEFTCCQLADRIDDNKSAAAPSLTVSDNADYIAVYGSVELATLAGACDYKFNAKQMQEILEILDRIENIPYDLKSGTTLGGRCNYLQEIYSQLMKTEYRKEINGDKPIKNRFAYFKSMLEDYVAD